MSNTYTPEQEEQDRRDLSCLTRKFEKHMKHMSSHRIRMLLCALFGHKSWSFRDQCDRCGFTSGQLARQAFWTRSK